MNRRLWWIGGAFCLFVCLCGGGSVIVFILLQAEPERKTEAQHKSKSEVTTGEVSEKEKKAFRDFLERKLPDTDGLQIIEWKVAKDKNTRTVSVSFRAKGDRGNKVLWDGTMVVRDGKVISKKAYYVGPDYGRSFPVGQVPPNLDTGHVISEDEPVDVKPKKQEGKSTNADPQFNPNDLSETLAWAKSSEKEIQDSNALRADEARESWEKKFAAHDNAPFRWKFRVAHIRGEFVELDNPGRLTLFDEDDTFKGSRIPVIKIGKGITKEAARSLNAGDTITVSGRLRLITFDYKVSFDGKKKVAQRTFAKRPEVEIVVSDLKYSPG